MNRNLFHVLGSMLDFIPQQLVLRVALEEVKEISIYAAPETMGPLWNRVSEILNEAMPSIESLEDWQRKILIIFMGPNSKIIPCFDLEDIFLQFVNKPEMNHLNLSSLKLEELEAIQQKILSKKGFDCSPIQVVGKGESFSMMVQRL